MGGRRCASQSAADAGDVSVHWLCLSDACWRGAWMHGWRGAWMHGHEHLHVSPYDEVERGDVREPRGGAGGSTPLGLARPPFSRKSSRGTGRSRVRRRGMIHISCRRSASVRLYNYIRSASPAHPVPGDEPSRGVSRRSPRRADTRFASRGTRIDTIIAKARTLTHAFLSQSYNMRGI